MERIEPIVDHAGSVGLEQPFWSGDRWTGNVYIADSGNHAIKQLSAATQQVTPIVSSGLFGPQAVAVDGLGSVYIADTDNNAIKKWSAATQQVTTLVSSGLNAPFSLAPNGPGGVYMADSNNLAIKLLSLAYLYLSTTSKSEGSAAGANSLVLDVIPSTATRIAPAMPLG